MPDSFVTVHHGQRHTDMLWRIATTAGGWVYMLPVVIYNGEPRWTVATDIADLLPPRHRTWIELVLTLRHGPKGVQLRRTLRKAEEKGTMTLIERARKWGEERETGRVSMGIENGTLSSPPWWRS